MASSLVAVRPRIVEFTAALACRPLHWMVSAPQFLFSGTLALMLFRPPNVEFYSLDRIALGVLIFAILLRSFLLRESLAVVGPVTWPMFGLLLLAFAELSIQPYESANWSLFAAKWAVPFLLYHLAQVALTREQALKHFETFVLIILGYLIFVSVAFFVGARGFVFPAFILDESLGIHADRARGPFLQAVANGVSLNILGLLALDSFRRRRLRGFLAMSFVLTFPIAIVATKTRAVWLSTGASLVLLLLACHDRRIRLACKCLLLVVTCGFLVAALPVSSDGALSDRIADRSPLDYRAEVYRAGWDMFLEKPLFGWNTTEIQTELSTRITSFRVETFILHNTYLEIAVEHGVLGIALYAWLLVDLFRLGRRRLAPAFGLYRGFLDQQFRRLWPLIVLVFVINACFVVMNYQFVSGLLFTLAGILAAQNRRYALEEHS